MTILQETEPKWHVLFEVHNYIFIKSGGKSKMPLFLINKSLKDISYNSLDKDTTEFLADITIALEV